MIPARIAILLAALTLGSLGLVVEVDRVPGGGVTLEGFWCVQAGVAVALLAGAITRSADRRRSFVLAAAFVIGVAGQLQLTAPLWLQFLDLRPDRLAQGTAPIGVAAILIQTAVVLALGRSRVRPLATSLRAALSPGVVITSLVAFVFCAAHAAPLFERGAEFALPYVILLGAAAALCLLNTLHVIAFSAQLPREDAEAFDGWLHLHWPGDAERGGAVGKIAALFVLLTSLVLAVVVFERVPHLPDEGAYLFQARMLARGQLAALAPPVPEAFSDYLFEFQNGRWYATTNPGWAGVLAVGVLFGVPWLVNPLLAALGVLLAHSLVRRWGGASLANVVALLLATSPWYLFLAASQMTHVVTLVPLLGAALLLTPTDSPRPALRAAAAGLLFGFIVLVRPLDGLIAGTFAGVWLLAAARPLLRVVVPYALGCIGGGIWLLPFNAYYTGHALRDPMNAYADRLWYPGVNAMGFGADVGNIPGSWGGLDPLPGHGLLDVVINANQNLYNLNFDLLGWATGSVVLILVHLLFGQKTSKDKWLLAFGLLIALGYSVYWFSGGPDFGPRYWFFVLLPCLWLTARGLVTVSERLAAAGVANAARGRVACAVALLVAVTLVTFVPWRATSRYTGYRDFHGDFLRMTEDGLFGRALVLVHTTDTSDGRSATYLNDPFLSDDTPVFVRDAGPEMEARLRDAFPDRPVIHVAGRSIAGDHARIVEERP